MQCTVSLVRNIACYRIELFFFLWQRIKQHALFGQANILFYVHVLCTLQISMRLLFVLHPRNVNETHERNVL